MLGFSDVVFQIDGVCNYENYVAAGEKGRTKGVEGGFVIWNVKEFSISVEFAVLCLG